MSKLFITGIFLILFLTACEQQPEVDPSNPGNCISMKSDCNVCSRNDVDSIFHCTMAFCENEKFVCINFYE